MDTMAQASYTCGTCQQPLDADNLYAHPCFQVTNMPGELQEVSVVEPEEVTYLEADGVEEGALVTYREVAEEKPQKKFRVKMTSSGKRGEWSETDVMRLLDVFIKNLKTLPKQEKLHNHYLWDRVMRDLQPYGNFSRHLVQMKLKKLRKATKAILNSGVSETKWPFMSKCLEILRLEEDQPAIDEVAEDNSDNVAATTYEEDEHDDNEGVSGLRRWTVKETRHLIEVYKKYLPKFFESQEPRKLAWDDIIADLQYGLRQRFTMHQIRSKVRNAQNTYRSIAEKKRKRPHTQWPLFEDMANLAKVERELATMYNVPIAIYRRGGNEDPDSIVATSTGPSPYPANAVRWSEEETKELLQVYKKYMPSMLMAESADEKTDIWTNIATEVNLIRRHKVSPEVVQGKIDTLKLQWSNKQENGPSDIDFIPFEEPLNEIMSMEKQICTDFLETELDDEDDSAVKLEIFHVELDDEEGAEEEREEERPAAVYDRGNDVAGVQVPNHSEDSPPPMKKSKSSSHVPPWFLHYQKEAHKRHTQRVAMETKLLDAFERLLDRIGVE